MKGTVYIARFDEAAPPNAAIKKFQTMIAERWPDVKETLPVEQIKYGDPDGQGDLQRTKEYALRVVIP